MRVIRAGQTKVISFFGIHFVHQAFADDVGTARLLSGTIPREFTSCEGFVGSKRWRKCRIEAALDGKSRAA